MHIHCPHCRNAIEVIEGQELRDVTCPSCGSSFNLLPDETVARFASEHRTLGHFELLDPIGVGAFGEVWTAHDTELDRTVAIKLPRRGQLSAEEAEAFLREARSAARLSHAGIVTVHEVGKADGQLFIVSDYVRGVTLADWLTGKKPAPKEAAELVARLADAVQHAHEHGVIHRDLKPSNIMLDELGQPRIMDFGLAKREAGEITVTMDGKILGTPAYMSPEQAGGSAHDADARSDVYSLGVILFELLTGELPFRGNARMLVHQVIHDDPPSPRRFSSQIPADLETVCLKCLEKDPTRRFASAREFAEDLRRFLSGEPIRARPITSVGRAWRYCRRKPQVAGLSAAILVLLVTVAVVGVVSARRDAALRQLAESRLYRADMGQARQAWERGDLERLEELLRRHVPEKSHIDRRGFEWYYLWRLWHREVAAERVDLSDQRRYTANNLAVPKVGTRVAVAVIADRKGGPVVRLVDVDADHEPESIGFARNSTGWPPLVAISDNGQLLAYPTEDKSQLVLLDLGTREEQTIKLESHVNEVRFSPDGSTLAMGCADRSVVLWDIRQRQVADRLPDHPRQVLSLAYSPDGTVLVARCGDASVRAWDVKTNAILWTETTNFRGGHGLAYSPDAKYVAWAVGTAVAVRGTSTEEEDEETVRVLMGARDTVRSVAFSHDSRLVAAGSRDGRIRLWVLPDFMEYGVISGYNSMYALGFLPPPDGRLVFGGYEGGLVIRSVPASEYEEIIPGPIGYVPGDVLSHAARSLVSSPEGQILAAFRGNDPWRIDLWRLTPSGVGRLDSVPVAFPAGGLAFSEQGVLAVSDRRSAAVHLFDFQAKAWKDPLTGPPKSHGGPVAFSPSGRRLAVGCQDGRAIAWDVSDRRVMFDKERLHDGPVARLCFCGDETTLMTGGTDGKTAVWDVDHQELVHDFGPQGDAVTALAASRDGRILAAGHFAGAPSINLWHGRSWTDLDTLRGHTLTVWGLAIFPDLRTLASVSGDRTIRLWDLETREERFLIEEEVPGSGLALSPDARTLAVAFPDGRIKLYRAATPEEVAATPGWSR